MSQIPGGKTGLRIPTPGTSPLSPAAASKLQTQRKSGKKLADKPIAANKSKSGSRGDLKVFLDIKFSNRMEIPCD